jgi:hypothetical protein
MTRRPKSLLLASVFAACAPGSAAASSWSPAQPIAGTKNVGMPLVVFTRAGHGLAAYSTNASSPSRTPTLRGAHKTGRRLSDRRATWGD